MNLVRMELEGFRSFRDPLTISFNEGVTYIVGTNHDHHSERPTSNGSGKTSILDAVCWALYGKTPTGLEKDAVINRQCDRARVVLFLEGLMIDRSKERDHGEELTYSYQGGPLQESNLLVIQKALEEIYGISFKTFCNTCYWHKQSKVSQFLTASPSERVKIMGELINDSLYKQTAKLCRVWERECKQEQEDLYSNRKKLERIITEREEELGEVTEELKMNSIHRENRKLEIAQEIAKHKKEIKRLQDDVLAAPKDVMEDIMTRIENTKIRIRRAQKIEGKLQHIIDQALLKSGDKCPTCRRIMTFEHELELRRQKKDAEEKLYRQNKQRRKDEKALSVLESKRTQFRDLEVARVRAIRDIEKLQTAIRQLQDDALPTEDVYLKKRRVKLEKEIKKLKKDLSKVNKTYDELIEKEPILSRLVTAFGSEIPDMLLDRQRLALDHYTRAYMMKLVGKEYRLLFPENAKNKFEIVMVTRDGQEVPVETYSTGELIRTSVATIMAVRKSMLDTKCCPFTFFFMDEFGEGLDEAGRIEVQELMTTLAGEPDLRTVLLTLPHKDLAEGYPTIEVQKQNRVSSVIS